MNNGIAQRLLTCQSLIGSIPGALAQANIVANMFLDRLVALGCSSSSNQSILDPVE